MNYPNVLIVESSERIDQTSSVFFENIRSAGFRPRVIAQPGLSAYLKQAMRTDQQPIAVLIDTDVDHPIALAREIRTVWPPGHIIFVRKEEQYDELRRDLSRAPMIGSQWSLLKDSDSSSLQKIIVDADRIAQRRAKLRTTLDRANTQISASKQSDGVDSRRHILSERYLASILEQARDAIIGIDSDLQVLYWNSTAEKLFGISSHEALERKLDQLPLWCPVVQSSLLKVRNGENALIEELTYPSADKEIPIEVVYSAVLDNTGALIGVSLVIRDITVRLGRLAKELGEAEATVKAIDNERLRLVALFDQAPGFMAVTRGPHHILEMANQAYHHTFGERALIGNSVKNAFPELHDHLFFEIRDEVFATGKPYVGRDTSVLVSRKLGEPPQNIFIDFVYQPIVEADGTVSGIFCQGHDVTEQKKMQDKLVQYQIHLEQLVAERTAELQKTEFALQQSQKLEAIGKLTGGVAHDFNNILHVIGGNLELLSLKFADDSSALNRIKSASTAVDRGAKLSSQLLAFARRQPLQPVSTSVGNVLRDLDDLLRRALGEEIEIETVISGGLWTAMVDRNQLENVILNLAINARDAMQARGKLTLEVGNAMLDDLYALEHSDVPVGQYVMLSVSDNGAGMTAEVLKHAFDPFFTTKKEGEGTGLGLSMAYGFVKQSGGHIKIYSEVGHGTTIKVYLPRNYTAESVVQDIRNTPAVGGQETILVVEDDPSVQATVVDILEGLGYHVLKASDAVSALAILKTGIAVDLLFTDVVMPGPLRSPELAKHAKELHPNIAVLFTSGYTQNAIVHGGRLDAGVELLSKPYRRADLARKIRHSLANQKQLVETNLSMIEAAASPADKSVYRILVVEDNFDAQEMLCELLNLLGYTATGISTAEAAIPLLNQHDVLLTDVNLPGMSGIELARYAAFNYADLKIVFASGGDLPQGLDFKSEVLLKPYSLDSLEKILPKNRL